MRRAVRRLRRRPPDADEAREIRDLEGRVRAALEENPTTESLAIEIRGLGEGIVELTGTVPDPSARRLAGELARTVEGADVLVNRILVEDGESSAPSNAG